MRKIIIAVILGALFWECQPKLSEHLVIDKKDYTQKVNPFIGTTNEGNTHPGAILPWGMASALPHTKNFREKANGPAYYEYGDKEIFGFGSVNLSGLGCPIAGAVPLKLSRGVFDWEIDNFASTYSNEEAHAGYYKVTLDKHQIEAEMTATQRSTYFRFNNQKTDEPFNLFLDLGANTSHKKGGKLRLVNPQLITGAQYDGGFCGFPKSTEIYFAIEVSVSTRNVEIYEDQKAVKGNDAEGNKAGVVWTFDKNTEEVEVKVGISLVSTENALENLRKEQGGYTFEEVHQLAVNEWNEQLSKVEIETSNVDNETIFYTALYHSLLLPHVVSDVNGEYYSRETEQVLVANDYTRYSTFSLWDTYRTLHPFLALMYPKEQRDMVVTMVEMYKECGRLPKWELFGYDTFCMVGDPAVPVITDSFLKGITDFDTDLALEGMLKSALDTNDNLIRPGIKQYINHGFIPIDDRGGDPKKFSWTNGIVWGPVSTTLEYNLADFNIAQLANAIGKNQVAETFYQRSQSFKNLYDPKTTFFRPKMKNGEWLESFDPTDRFFDIRWERSGGKGFVEGNAWQYNFFVPHAMKELKALMGEEVFHNKLSELFENGEYDLTNEPDITFPYLFNYVKGKESKTQELVRNQGDLHFTNSPDGIPGNDDAGTLSAWLVFSQLGFFPDAPGIPTYQLTTPKFDKAILHLDDYIYNGKTIEIVKTGKNERFFNQITVGDKTRDEIYQLSHSELVNAGKLIFHTNSGQLSEVEN
ncbi:glycoside hydrolase family 92 protein [Flammeovirga sp. MY04]|uniref:GH92 family glycosyl hydrolase n=1 Tax=Flammeovirga sp. MY04 TaxID=1191459 RepID=UPI000806386B|nr:GH92 family glycosyl hydrolase [Flammeovirga sp. MY04]ANQ52590.1 glycoside hydrolase family 92 protein [Flammeovirga sp. MY04]